MKKMITMLVLILSMLMVGCSDSKVESQTIIENIVLYQSTWEDIKNILPDAGAELVYNEVTGILEPTDARYAEYTINNVQGKMRFDLDSDDKLMHVLFQPKDYSKDSGDSLKTWVFNKYSDYEQITKDTGFVFTNGIENVELYITENPVDNTKYYGLYIEWTVVK